MGTKIKATVKDKLDPRILIPLLLLSTEEFEIFTISKGVVEIAQQDAWISVLLGIIVFLLIGYLLFILASRFPRENILQYNEKVWGKSLALFIAIGYLLFWSLYLTIMMENVSVTNKLFFLPETPLAVTILLLAFGSTWLVLYGFTAIVRFFQLMLPFFILPFLLLGLLALSNIKFSNFMPVLSNGVVPVIKGAIHFLGGFQGFEVILFAIPFITNAKETLKPILIGVLVMTFFDLIFSISAIGILGVENIKESLYPGIDIIRALEFPGFPGQRFGLFLTMPWLIGIFTTICLYLYLLAYGIMQVFSLKNKKAVVYLAIALLALATYIFPNMAWTLTVRKYTSLITLVFLYILPLSTLLIAVLRDKKEEYEV